MENMEKDSKKPDLTQISKEDIDKYLQQKGNSLITDPDELERIYSSKDTDDQWGRKKEGENL